MSRTVYVNGEFLPEEQAKISVFDRGFLFADAVYEVSSVLRGKLIDNDAHLLRLGRSLGELDMAWPISTEALVDVQKTLIEKNALDEGTVYLQVTRGAADRDFTYPAAASSSLVMFTQVKSLLNSPAARSGIRVISVPDLRWKRRDIKTVALVASAMAKQSAVNAGVDDAWMVEDGFVTEGTSNNAYIITATGTLVTRHLGSEILRGVTRGAVLALCRETGMPLEERPFSLTEAFDAAEAMITSASSFVYPVIEIDGNRIGTGEPGPVAKRLLELYIDRALQSTG